MQNLLNDVAKLLEKDERFFAEGKILKNAVTEAALKLDTSLLELLQKNKQIKEHFFVQAAGSWFFDQDKFIKFINNKEFLPDSFTAFKNHIGLTDEKDYLKDSGNVVLAWPYKDCVLEGGQDKEDVKRSEIFYNETLAPDEIDRLFEPKVLTNFKKIDKTGEHKIEQITEQDNLIIKGNNLLALHSLKKKYRGKVKLIYIDPPYNTGSDSFLYNDSFNHSTWLTFMKNRLEVAKELLANDGVICVQADDSEQAYLKVLLDEVFNKNFISTFYIQVRYPDKQLAKAMTFHKLVETIHIYSKTEKPKIYQQEEEYDFSKYIFEIKEKKKPQKKIQIGAYTVDVFQKDDFEIIKHDNPDNKYLKEIWASGKILDSSSTGRFFRDYLDGRYTEDGLGVLYKVYGIGDGASDYRYITGPQKAGATRGKYYQEVPKGRLDKTKANDLQALENYFDYAGYFGNCRHEGGVPFRGGKKPEMLIKNLLEFTTKTGDLVLDYHLGSGTTAAVAHKMGRKYIGIEQLDYGTSDSVTRLKNVIKGDKTGISEYADWKGGGSFVYAELKQWNEAYMQAIEEAKTAKELATIYKKMQAEAFFRYKIDLSKFEQKQLDQLSLEEQQKVLLECLDKNHLYVNYSEMEDVTYKIPAEEKKINKEFYS